MNVLSLFDGISAGRLALDRSGCQVDKFYASEIDKHAITVTQYNHPDTIQLGDITKWREWDIDFSEIGLILAGFPCQAWSVAGHGKGDNDPRGALVHDLLAIWHHIRELNPAVKYLFENVRMKQGFITYINGIFEVEPIEINSALVSAQNRKRLYWTNIPNVTQPEDQGILLKDIVHEGTITDKEKSYRIDANYYKGANYKQYKEKARRQLVADYMVPHDKTLQLLDSEAKKGKIGYFGTDSQANRVYSIHGKCVTLCGEAGQTKVNAHTPSSIFGCLTPQRPEKRQNGQRFSDGKKFYTLTAQDQHGILTEGYIRKLTPIECERLQTFDDNYTKVPYKNSNKIMSNSQRYKMLGNSWTVDVIAHIFRNLDKPADNESNKFYAQQALI